MSSSYYTSNVLSRSWKKGYLNAVKPQVNIMKFIIGRDDDNIETIKKRFLTFTAETEPLVAQYEA